MTRQNFNAFLAFVLHMVVLSQRLSPADTVQKKHSERTEPQTLLFFLHTVLVLELVMVQVAAFLGETSAFIYFIFS